jgi:hypothetical protein
VTETDAEVKPGPIHWDEVHWRRRQEAHAQRVTPWIAPRLARRVHGDRHPVDDFLFDYYAWRPAQLARWHPGAGIVLNGDVADFRRVNGYRIDGDSAWADADRFPVADMRAFLEILEATAGRPAAFGCFGRHEWAMVYRQRADEVRHASWPLRLPAAGIAQVVESAPLRCTHFDAFRFYTEDARPLNIIQPTRAQQADLEQPGCLHATMDLYKWCFRSYPAIGAELTADCFELAREVRVIDMRASPYDLRDLGYSPIAIETARGRAEYVEHQQDFAARGSHLRQRVIDALHDALRWATVPA